MSWLTLFRRPRPSSTTRARQRARPVRPSLEFLEDRLAPAVFTVNNTNDFSIAAGVNPTTGEITGMPGVVTLRSAIEAANSNSQSNTILLSVPGTYQITIPPLAPDDTPATENNATGDFDILPHAGGDLAIINTSGGPVTVDGGGLDRVFDINPNLDPMNPGATPKITVTLVGFAIQNGKASPGDAATGSGGAIRDQGNPNLTLFDMALTGNSASADGGAISLENTVSVPWTLTILNSVISGNTAGDAGGGIDTDGHGTVVINNSQILNNTSLNQGGGVWLDAITNGTVQESATASLNGDNISGNTSTAADNGGTANVGGGIGNAGDASNGLTGSALASGITIANSTLSNNSAAGDGGAFGDENNQGTLTVNNSTFTGNKAGFSGGALFTSGLGLTVTDSSFTGNTATGNTATTGNSTATPPIPPFGTVKVLFSTTPIAPTGTGGAIWTSDLSNTLLGTTIQGNTAQGKGGGLFVVGGGTFLLQNSTLTGNTVSTTANNAPDVFGTVSDIAASTGNTIGIVDANTNLANGPRAANLDFQSPFGLAGVIVDPNGNVIEFIPSLGARINVSQILQLQPSLFASVAFTSFGQLLVLTQQDGSVLQLTLFNGQLSISDLTPAVGRARAASVAFNNGQEVLVVTNTQGNVTQFTSAGPGSTVNLTTALSLTQAQSATVTFNPFNGEEVLVVTDVNGGVTLYALSGNRTLTPNLGTTPSRTTSVAFQGPGANDLTVVDVDEMGNFIITFLVNGNPFGPFNLGPTAGGLA